MRSVKIAALIETVSPSSSLSMKRKKEDNESENYYTPPCLPSQLRQKSIGIIRRSLSENITPNKGFKKPRMLSDSGTPLSTRNQISPPVKETVKTLVIKPVDDTPAAELSNDTEPINDHRLPQSSPEHLPRQIFQSQSHSQLQPQPARQSQSQSQSQPEVQIQIPIKVMAQPKQNLQPQLQPQPQPQPKPQPKPKIQVPIKATPQPQLSQHQPLSQPKPLASTSVTQLQNSQYQSEPTQEEDEDDIKAEPVPSGFKLASNKVLFLNHVAQKRVAYLTKQLQDMNIDLSVYKADKDKKGPVPPISCPIENILNNSKSINCPDADDEICNSADDEFLRNLDVNNLVGKEGVF